VAREYEVTGARRVVNKFTMWLARRGWASQVVLTTTGRSSGEPRPVPVSPLDVDGTGYLVSPYGEVNWVKNARSNPEVHLRHGRQSRKVRLMELKPENTGDLLLRYWKREKITRPYFDVGSSPTAQDFKKEADRHPVFRIITQS